VPPPVGRKELCDGKDSSLGSRLVLIMEYRCGEIESFSSLTYVNLLAMCALKIIERELRTYCKLILSYVTLHQGDGHNYTIRV